MGIKYPVNELFFNEWSIEMAYVLGFLYADGNLENSPYIRGKYLRVMSTDRDRIEIIKTLLESKHVVYTRHAYGNRKRAFLLRIGSHKLYNQLAQMGMTPRKSLTMKFPRVPKECSGAFVRGYFDGDGCVFLERYPVNGRTRPPKRIRTIFTSGSKNFLLTLQSVLRKCGHINQTMLHPHSKRGTFQLRLSTESSVLLFTFMYACTPPGLYLRRKCDIFMQYFKARPEWIDSKTQRVLKDIQRGLVAK